MELKKDKRTFGKSKKIFIIAGVAIVVALIVVVAVILSGNNKQASDSSVTYVTKEASKVTIRQTLTAAGKVTGGKQGTVQLNKKKIKVSAVEETEKVKKGDPLVYYTDGTHTDAPYNAIVSEVEVPQSGEQVAEDKYIKVRSIDQLYLRITVPENKIDEISVGNSATVVVNSMSQKEFAGRITEKKDVSNELINGNSSDDDDSDNLDSSDEDDKSVSDDESSDDEDAGESDEDEDESSDDDNSYDNSDDELGDSNSDGESSSGSAYYTVTIKFHNNGKVRPGMSANCVITLSERDNLLSVPVAAIFYDKKNNTYVRLADGKDYKKKYVTIGEADANNVEIKSGLKLGEKVQVVNYTQEKSK